MSLPSMNGVGRLIEDPELRFTSGGKAVVRVRLAFNARKKDAQGNWVDGDSFFIDGTAFDQVAQNIADTLQRGMEVVVSGRPRTESWETQTGEKRSRPALLIDSIGPSLRSATARVERASRSGGQDGGQQQRGGQGGQQQGGWGQQGPAGDPWSQPAGQASGGWGGDEPAPF